MEATEISEFEDEVKEGGEKGLRHVSLIISVLAVLVAMVTVLGHRTHTEAVLSQTKAADQWNEYQAKKIRQTTLQDTADLLALLPSSNPEATQKKIEDYKKHIDKWNDDLTEEQTEAKNLEAEVHLAEGKASRYDLAEALLEIAVVLSSITLLTRQSHYYIAGVVLGIAGLVLTITGFLLK
jgi:hypothetical protein